MDNHVLLVTPIEYIYIYAIVTIYDFIFTNFVPCFEIIKIKHSFTIRILVSRNVDYVEFY